MNSSSSSGGPFSLSPHIRASLEAIVSAEDVGRLFVKKGKLGVNEAQVIGSKPTKVASKVVEGKGVYHRILQVTGKT